MFYSLYMNPETMMFFFGGGVVGFILFFEQILITS
jgi:hypothetical protein